MGILPIDLQAILVRMESVSKLRYGEQEGAALVQMQKESEMSKLSQIESTRVNQVKPHPEENAKVEDASAEGKRKKMPGKEEEKKGESKEKDDFEDPFKGTVIDTIR